MQEFAQTLHDLEYQPETDCLSALIAGADFPTPLRQAITKRATSLVKTIRTEAAPGLMEVFLAEYGLSTDEGIALMCLAEAALRVPDAATLDALIEDKIVPSAWGAHLGQSSSSLVNASTWALLLTGKVLDEGKGMSAILRGMIKRMGEPVIRAAVSRAMREMGAQFVLGETIDAALDRQDPNYSYSFDMLGEAAMTMADADAYYAAYASAIRELARRASGGDIRDNPGISIKLSALYPRYETRQQARVMQDLLPRLRGLVQQAAAAGIGLNIDAEECDRLSLSLDLIGALLADPVLDGWDGFGVVVQAYGKRASAVIDWLHDQARAHNRRIMVRLVKGAYWDTEIKRAQVEGLAAYPVWTQKHATDIAYLCLAQRLLGYRDVIYPQFATHNAHSVAAILEMAGGAEGFELQRLHGMGEALHDVVRRAQGTRCRIYAPVGAHRDLLAYLVRRLLENGANSSFVNQIVDESVPAEIVAADPFDKLGQASDLPLPTQIFGARQNARGWDVNAPLVLAQIETACRAFMGATWAAAPIMVAPAACDPGWDVMNPAKPDDVLGQVSPACRADVALAIEGARVWDAPVAERAAILRRAAEGLEAAHAEIFALLAREAGKTIQDAVAELREAVDFLRYYADEASRLTTPGLGIVTCISPWNFPVAIFTGQIAAALAAGNAVLAKPAEATSLCGYRVAQILHAAGVPVTALQFLPGTGAVVGEVLTIAPAVGAVAFTGSHPTALRIHRNMAENLDPYAALIAETGGLNAMIVDSTALPEQAIGDIVASAFQSAGQRCSACRVLYVQDDVADAVLTMLTGAMAQQVLGDPADFATDIGPVIDAAARGKILTHINRARAEGRLIYECASPAEGYFVSPTLVEIPDIAALGEEVFGPVLHVIRFQAAELDQIIADVNATGFGLTFGLHSRIDARVERISRGIKAGNIYVNRNQIGAVVGSQPFGGEGLSGTGPKAGGPHYLPVLTRGPAGDGKPGVIDLPGPTGESNRLRVLPKSGVYCIGPGTGVAADQVAALARMGVTGILAADMPVGELMTRADLAAVIADGGDLRALRTALAARVGAIIPLLNSANMARRVFHERHTCIDTTAAGGNASLLAQTV